MQKLSTVVVVALALAMSGCLSVCRLGKCESKYGSAKEWSEERQEWVRVETHYVGNADILAQYGLYPTMKMRWQLARLSCHWVPARMCGFGHRVAIPLGLVALAPGMVVDAVVDTIALPWDWKYRDNVGPDLCAPLDEERRYRSLCVICGATSDGKFARCRRREDWDTPNWNKYYGVCPSCIERAKESGYYFK